MKRLYSTVLSTAAVFCTILCGCSGNNTNSTIAATDSTIATPTDTTVKTTGEKIHINDSTLGEIWITELDGVAKNTLNNANFTSDSTFKYYSENGKPASLEGIDISSYNGEIDWNKVKDSGIDFAMIRIGGRGYGSDGTLYEDDKAIENINNAQNAGIKTGVYFFSQENGYTPMIYSPSKELYFKYDLSRLADIDIWYCEYSDVPNFYYQFSMWQYSSTATVSGIEGEVDLNICFTNIADYD